MAGEIKIKIEVEGGSNAEKEIKKVQGALNGGDSSLVGAMFKANIASEAFMRGIDMLVDGLKTAANATMDFAKSALSSAASVQQTRLSFEVMLGSAEKAKVLMKELSDFAYVTPFQLEDVQELTKRLLAYGVSQQEIIPTMKTLGNLAAGLGTDKLPAMVLAYGQVKAATKLTGMELRQFTEAGVPLLQLLADTYRDKYGKPVLNTTAKVQEAISKGVIKFNDVKKALDSLAGPTGKWGSLMEKQSYTLNGMLSNVEDLKFRLLSLAGGIDQSGVIIKGGFLDVVSTQLTKLMSWINRNQESINAFFIKVSTKIGEFIGGLVDGLKKLAGDKTLQEIFSEVASNAIKQVSTWIKQFIDWISAPEGQKAIRDMASGIGSIVTFGMSLAGWIMQNKDTILSLGKAFAAVATAIGLVKSALSIWAFISSPAGLGVAVTVGALAIIIANWDAVSGAIKGAINTLGDWMSAAGMMGNTTAFTTDKTQMNPTGGLDIAGQKAMVANAIGITPRSTSTVTTNNVKVNVSGSTASAQQATQTANTMANMLKKLF